MSSLPPGSGHPVWKYQSSAKPFSIPSPWPTQPLSKGPNPKTAAQLPPLQSKSSSQLSGTGQLLPACRVTAGASGVTGWPRVAPGHSQGDPRKNQWIPTSGDRLQAMSHFSGRCGIDNSFDLLWSTESTAYLTVYICIPNRKVPRRLRPRVIGPICHVLAYFESRTSWVCDSYVQTNRHSQFMLTKTKIVHPKKIKYQPPLAPGAPANWKPLLEPRRLRPCMP